MTKSIMGKIAPYEAVFSLDIGTKSITGIVAKKQDEKFIIVDTEIMEYSERAMYDGQIHDIDKVARAATIVKEKLEERLGFQLTEVAIAAAGRALKTHRVQVGMDIDSTKEIDQATIQSLEIEGIQKAQKILDGENMKDVKYYCVGHTVIHYYLNGSMITSLKGHRGDKIEADILATFLPHVVVDSLYAVMDKIGLEVVYLTLEPIAAIHVAIPPKVRLLNLALVDIGAGTSDIAITQDGTIVSYAMASIAGDEITEAIAKEFLLDFDTAEKLKIDLNQNESHTFEDIVGISYTMTTEEIVKRIALAIENLAKEISQKIIEYNGKAPSAVFCIGGGSQIPTLTQYIADDLGLKEERVVVRGTEIIQNVEFLCEKLQGPEFITPIGICMISTKEQAENFIKVGVNENVVKLFQTKELFVSDALIKAGVNAKQLIGRSGKNLNLFINGEKKLIKGTFGEAAQIYVNGKLSNLDERIYHMDQIIFHPAVNGQDGVLSLKDFIEKTGVVRLNDVEIHLVNHVLVNEEKKDVDYILKDGDQITTTEIHNVLEVLKKFNIEEEQYHIYVNGIEADPYFILKSEDEIVICEKGEKISNDAKLIKEDTIKITVNNEEIEMLKKGKEPIFVDIFDYFDFDRTKAQGTLIMELNGERAAYTDSIQDGDRIEIYWKK
ncbi:cell division protein FtsA [Inediibacterium massiliense]|uniref:cell division protein FtsA n=1 Tax=Inediibacterium massiliense TaxID=1658111 RepID=UPI0006B4517E|nr:cell division FtsA domain-containing protein [Inediibacterium massiliense]